jgi:uncharacterized membrane-anchored protein YitT (DUF2179 family)
LKTVKSAGAWALLSLGAALDALAFHFFFAPNQIAPGGVTGAALLTRTFFPRLPLGALALAFSVALLLLGFWLVGPFFGFKTIYCGLLIPAVIGLAERVAPVSQPLADDVWIQMLSGVFLSGAGLALMFNQGASSGGTDILARILNQYYHINLGQGLFLIDFLVVVGCGGLFGLEKGMYAFAGIVLYAVVIDYILAGFNTSAQVAVYTTRSEEVRAFIVSALARGVTLYQARGGLSGADKEVVVTVLKRSEFIRLKAFMRELDPGAFITVQKVHEVFGEGFSPPV